MPEGLHEIDLSIDGKGLPGYNLTRLLLWGRF
jgi:hypothetical protein